LTDELTRADERQRVRRQLERYCGRDTEGMVWIVEALLGAVRPEAGLTTPQMTLICVDSMYRRVYRKG